MKLYNFLQFYFSKNALALSGWESRCVRGDNSDYLNIVENDTSSSAISELYPERSEAVIKYRRFDLKGKVTEKRNILQTLSLKVESIEQKLKGTTYNPIANDVGNLYNNLHIRHDNFGGNPNNNIIDMSDEELEKWYDITYDTTLTALMICHYLEYNKEIDNLPNYYKKD